MVTAYVNGQVIGLLGAGVFTTQKMIKEQPGIVRAFVKAMQDTLTDPKAAVALLARYD